MAIIRTTYNSANAPPQQILIAAGPRLEVLVGVPPTPPNPGAPAAPSTPAGGQSAWALIDTGATDSCINEQLAKQLNLSVVDRKKIGGVGGESEHDVYLGAIAVPALGTGRIGPFVGVKLDPKTPIILGRDFLSMCVLIYDGVHGQTTICR